MIGITCIDFDQEIIAQIMSDNFDVKELRTIIPDCEWYSFLKQYDFGSRGEVYDYSVVEGYIDQEGQGKIAISFIVKYEYSCEDFSSSQEYTMDIEINVDIQQQTLNLKGENWSTRDPDEI